MNGIGGDSVWLVYDAGRRRLRALNAIGRSAAAVDLSRLSRALRRRHPAARWRRRADGPGHGIRLVGGARLQPRRDGLAGAVAGAARRRDRSRGRRLRRLRRPASSDGRHRRPLRRRRRRRRARHPVAALSIPIGSVANGSCRPRWPPPSRASPTRAPRRSIPARWGGASPRAPRRAGSPLAAGDLAEHRADWVEPLRLGYRGGEAATLPPPTQGFAALAILSLLEGFDVAALDDADHVHLAWRRRSSPSRTASGT